MVNISGAAFNQLSATMAYTQTLEPAVSADELTVLKFLDRHWPHSTTVTTKVLPRSTHPIDKSEFVDLIQSLSDNGLILYEAFLMEASSGLRFIETMITARGRAALKSAEIHA